MNKVSQVSTAAAILGQPCSLPVFIAPAALARLGHPDGEMNLVRAAASEQIAMGVSLLDENIGLSESLQYSQMSINASCSIDEVMSARSREDQPLFFQVPLLPIVYCNSRLPKF